MAVILSGLSAGGLVQATLSGMPPVAFPGAGYAWSIASMAAAAASAAGAWWFGGGAAFVVSAGALASAALVALLTGRDPTRGRRLNPGLATVVSAAFVLLVVASIR